MNIGKLRKLSVKDSEWIPNREFNVMENTVKKVLENINKISMLSELCVEEYRENADGLSAQQIIDLIHDYLNDGNNEVNTYIFLHLLAYYPKSMTSYNLTPLMQRLIALAYYYSQNARGEDTPKLSMDDLAELFHRSKSTIYDCIQKHGELEKMLKIELEEERLRAKAQKEAYRQLIEEEKEKLRIQRENDQRVAQTSKQTIS
jgi:predicted DNA-binding protein YlxM (UPF0122 family)